MGFSPTILWFESPKTSFHKRTLEAFGSAYTHGGVAFVGVVTWKNHHPKKYVINVFFCFLFSSALDISSLVQYGLLMLCFFSAFSEDVFLHFWVISGFVTVITLWSIFHRKVPHCWHAASYTSKWSEPQKWNRPPEKKQGCPFVENPMVWTMIHFLLKMGPSSGPRIFVHLDGGVPIQISALLASTWGNWCIMLRKVPERWSCWWVWWDGRHPTAPKIQRELLKFKRCFILGNFDKSICWCGKGLKKSCDLSLPLRCCVVSWKRAATKARLSRLLMYRDMTGVQHHQRSLQAPGDCMSWRKTSFYRSWQDRFKLLVVPEATIAPELVWSVPISRSIIYTILSYTMNYLRRWLILDLSWQPAELPFWRRPRGRSALRHRLGQRGGPWPPWPLCDVARFGMGQPGSLRSWNPSVSWREIFAVFFFFRVCF